VLDEQKGNCFDYAILLASLLIGVGYDAYCVCGYASEDVCLFNLGRNICPLLKDEEEVKNTPAS
jgi:transglutaminase-like putative cysteine protease